MSADTQGQAELIRAADIADAAFVDATVGIVGLGLIGGSIAHDLAAAGVRVLAHDRDPLALERGLAAGVIQGPLGSRFERLPEVDVLLIAVPVDATLEVLDGVAQLDPQCLVMDVGSTKTSIVRAADASALGSRFVGAHPLAGDHRSGLAAAGQGLFRGATVYLCPAAGVAPTLRDRAWHFWQRLDAKPQLIDAEEHDALLAWTSHLPQATASALARALLAADIAGDQLGPGGRDTTRLAASDPDMWSAILLDNASNVGDALDRLTREIETLRQLIASGDRTLLHRFLAEGRAFRV
ncbi:MAG TPA: prephenate dehydrogenase/arogenate dehydrogenase family protein [Longimicrobiales bacterium]|nr:prephenate dehydrogenase/arogenate dehydrogenase family protein [Longimicrobiales bacterium]